MPLKNPKKNLTPENAPMLSENECSMVNLYRALPQTHRQAVLKLIFSLAMGREDKK